MTENEAIKELETSIDLAKMCTQNYERKNEIQGYEMAIQALEEVQQYRQIGSVELFAETKKLSDLTKKCGTIGKVFDECAEYAAIGTVKECRAAVEKQTAKKPDYEGDGYADGQLVYDTWICPSCGKHYEVDYDSYDYCPRCGQHIDRRNEEWED